MNELCRMEERRPTDRPTATSNSETHGDESKLHLYSYTYIYVRIIETL